MPRVDGSQTAWPTRWAPIAQHSSPLRSSSARFSRAVARLGERAVDLEVVAPAGELEAVEAPAAGLRRELLERQVGPLAGEQRDGTCHVLLLSVRTVAAGAAARTPARTNSRALRAMSSPVASSGRHIETAFAISCTAGVKDSITS